MSTDAKNLTAEERAASAADELAAEGLSVTAAAVRERSGVRMSTALAASRDWKERDKKSREEFAEPVPEQLQARLLSAFEGAWREARALSRSEFDGARAGLEAKLLTSEGEVGKLTAAVDELEEEREAARVLAAEQAAEQASQLAEERSRADRAEGALGAMTAERDRLIAQLEAMRSVTDD